MLRHILRLLPHSSQASNKFSTVFRQRTIATPLRPSVFICLGVSVATFATIITIHGDSAQEPQADVPMSVQIPKSSFRDYLLPQKVPPSPTTDETFDLSSGSGFPKEKEIGIGRVDTILLPRYVHEQCPFYFHTVLISVNSNQPCEDVFSQKVIAFSSTLNYSLFGVYDGHNGNEMSNFLGETLIYAVLGELAQLYSEHASAALKPDHIDVGSRFSFVMKDTPDVDQQLQLRGDELGLINGLHRNTHPSDEEINQSIKKAFVSLDSLAVNELTKIVLDRRLPKEEGLRLVSLPNAGSSALLGIYNNVKR